MRATSKTKTKILEFASSAFADTGYRDTTVREICKGAHSNIASINYYYRSKRNLFLLVLESWMNEGIAINEFEIREVGDFEPTALKIDSYTTFIKRIFLSSRDEHESAKRSIVLVNEFEVDEDAIYKIIHKILHEAIVDILKIKHMNIEQTENDAEIRNTRKELINLLYMAMRYVKYRPEKETPLKYSEIQSIIKEHIGSSKAHQGQV